MPKLERISFDIGTLWKMVDAFGMEGLAISSARHEIQEPVLGALGLLKKIGGSYTVLAFDF